MLQDHNGQWVKGHCALANLVSSYFTHFFQAARLGNLLRLVPHPLNKILANHNELDSFFNGTSA